MGKVSKEVATIIYPETRLPLSRRGHRYGRDMEAKHARHLGEVIHAWNCAHGALFLIFAELQEPGDYAAASRLWHVAQSDKAQRDMLGALAEVRFKAKKPYLNGLKWALTALAELSQIRNATAHTEMVVYYDKMIPGLATKDGHSKTLERLPLAKTWVKLRGDLRVIANYLQIIHLSMELSTPRPLTRRPRLQCVRSKSAAIQKRRNLAKKEARERQRQSSQP